MVAGADPTGPRNTELPLDAVLLSCDAYRSGGPRAGSLCRGFSRERGNANDDGFLPSLCLLRSGHCRKMERYAYANAPVSFYDVDFHRSRNDLFNWVSARPWWPAFSRASGGDRLARLGGSIIDRARIAKEQLQTHHQSDNSSPALELGHHHHDSADHGWTAGAAPICNRNANGTGAGYCAALTAAADSDCYRRDRDAECPRRWRQDVEGLLRLLGRSDAYVQGRMEGGLPAHDGSDRQSLSRVAILSCITGA
jgi:hypothetical protein